MNTETNVKGAALLEEVELLIEELEEVIAPGYDHQHNETRLSG